MFHFNTEQSQPIWLYLAKEEGLLYIYTLGMILLFEVFHGI